MDDGKVIWSWWQSLVGVFQSVFTRGGWVRFVQWLTGLVLCPEEHTITQILTALGLESRWRVAESFAEYGAWDRPAVERQLIRLVEQERPAEWGGYRVMAVDDTKEHRTSGQVWGTCTYHESTARCPNRAETVRAHNWCCVACPQRALVASGLSRKPSMELKRSVPALPPMDRERNGGGVFGALPRTVGFLRHGSGVQ
jgi:hypothetical protein